VVCPEEVTSDSEVEGGAQDSFLQNLVKKKERKKERKKETRPKGVFQNGRINF